MAQFLFTFDFRKDGDASVDRSRVVASVGVDKRMVPIFESVGIYPRRTVRSFRP